MLQLFRRKKENSETDLFCFVWLKLVAEGNSRCLSISDGSLLPLLAAKAGFDKVGFMQRTGPTQLQSSLCSNFNEDDLALKRNAFTLRNMFKRSPGKKKDDYSGPYLQKWVTVKAKRILTSTVIACLEAFSTLVQSKRKIFLSTCPSDKHYIKFGCPIPREFLSKTFCQVPKLNGARKDK